MEMSLAKVANEFTAKNDRSKKFWNPSIEIPNAATERENPQNLLRTFPRVLCSGIPDVTAFQSFCIAQDQNCNSTQ